jgi:hypothetical protein
MGTTSDYCRAPCGLLKDRFETWLVNAKDVKHLPGRPKTTVAAAMLDRLLHRSVLRNLDCDSSRLRGHHARTDTLHRATTGTRRPLT